MVVILLLYGYGLIGRGAIMLCVYTSLRYGEERSLCDIRNREF